MKSARTLPRYGSGHKSAGRTDGRTDGRTTPKQYPSAYGGEKNFSSGSVVRAPSSRSRHFASGFAVNVGASGNRTSTGHKASKNSSDKRTRQDEIDSDGMFKSDRWHTKSRARCLLIALLTDKQYDDDMVYDDDENSTVF
ncbi:hypothetical protein DPMN_034487 [Dreissena polymorpha]|uniref:Uncharacterized protein n=1 Tax=Dreissena polymorpha TaxID=45954 RepID=A0A9D4RM52_DREPO|nr:hypothetical protein DPMN_034487 [Dreissena polymorpha]